MDELEKLAKEQEDKQTPEQKEEWQLRLIKMAISSTEGWQNLAKSVKNSGNSNAKNKCIALLRKLAGDKEIDLPISDKEGPVTLEDCTETVKVKFADLLEQQLNQHFQKLDE